MSEQCRVGASMAGDYYEHAAECPECEAHEAARSARLATAVQLLRSWVEDGTPWDEYNECVFCGERWKTPRVHGKDCAWVAAQAFVESEPR